MEFDSISKIPSQIVSAERGIGGPEPSSDESPFQDMMKGMVSATNDLQVGADQAMENFVGGEEQDIHKVMMAINKAELSFRFMMEVRNKMLEAYQEIKRMSV